MSWQQLTFDQANTRQHAGINQAVQHSGPTWLEYATEYVQCYLTEHPELFCDDVWTHGLTRPVSARAFGQVMKTAIREGWMVATGQVRPSAQSNNSLRNVYRSLICTGTPTQYPTFGSDHAA